MMNPVIFTLRQTADAADWAELTDAGELFEAMGFPAPGRAPLMPLDHQVAQKLHAVSGPGDRARDLIDLQLIDARAEVDLTAARAVCRRLFSYRRAQTWPPAIAKQKGWDEMYAALAEGLPVLQDVDEAIRWANEFVARIEDAR